MIEININTYQITCRLIDDLNPKTNNITIELIY